MIVIIKLNSTLATVSNMLLVLNSKNMEISKEIGTCSYSLPYQDPHRLGLVNDPIFKLYLIIREISWHLLDEFLWEKECKN